jgi:hypothetical protein
MGMATAKPVVLGLAALALAAAGCGRDGKSSASRSAASSRAASSQPGLSPAGSATGAFVWLRPRAARAGWPLVSIADGAAMAYPPGWQRVNGDPGTATAVLRDGHRDFVGYLNLTPHQGDETLRNWRYFRVAHNAQEGDRDVKALAAAQGLRFRSGHGACVRDSYTTSTGARFIELACLVAGPRATSVIVGAAPPGAWTRISPSIELAISAFTT